MKAMLIFTNKATRIGTSILKFRFKTQLCIIQNSFLFNFKSFYQVTLEKVKIKVRVINYHILLKTIS